jgi:hypothetical protein
MLSKAHARGRGRRAARWWCRWTARRWWRRCPADHRRATVRPAWSTSGSLVLPLVVAWPLLLLLLITTRLGV